MATTLHMATSWCFRPPASLFTASPYLPTSFPALSLPNLSIFPSSKHRFPVLCVIPARDIIINFGKYRGSQMGTLPSRYLQWLCRELGQGRSRVWADYAADVLKDPFYKDRLEWESIEKGLLKSDMKRGGPHAWDADSLDSMKALGWNMEDRAGWNKVNFSALGTTSGGRIPRLAPVNATPPFVKTGRKNAPEQSRQPQLAQNSEPLSLREELIRRRLLRRERSSPTPTKAPAMNADPVFPGRDALLEDAKNAFDRRK